MLQYHLEVESFAYILLIAPDEVSDKHFFLFFHENICAGYLLEVPYQMFLPYMDIVAILFNGA